MFYKKPIPYAAHNSHKPKSTPEQLKLRKTFTGPARSPEKTIRVQTRQQHPYEIPQETTRNFGIYYKNYKNARRKVRSLNTETLLPMLKLSERGTFTSMNDEQPLLTQNQQNFSPKLQVSEQTDRYQLNTDPIFGLSQVNSTKSLYEPTLYSSRVGPINTVYNTHSQSFLKKQPYQKIVSESNTPVSARKTMFSLCKRAEYKGEEKLDSMQKEYNWSQKKINKAIKDKMTVKNLHKTVYSVDLVRNKNAHRSDHDFDNVRYHKNLVVDPFKQVPPFNLA